MIRYLTSEYHVCADLFGRITYPIRQLLSQTTVERSYSNVTLQAAMLRILKGLHSRDFIVEECSLTIPFPDACLRADANVALARSVRNDAAILVDRLLVPFFNRQMTGESGAAIKAAVDIMEERNCAAFHSACDIIRLLCMDKKNGFRGRIVSQGVVPLVMKCMRDRFAVKSMLKILEPLSKEENIIAMLDADGALPLLLMIMGEHFMNSQHTQLYIAMNRERYCKIRELCVIIIHQMCCSNIEKMRELDEVQEGRDTLERVIEIDETRRTVGEKAVELFSGMVEPVE